VRKPPASLTLTRTTLNKVLLQKISFPEAVKAGQIKVQGDPRKLMELLGLLDTFTPTFAVVEPRIDNAAPAVATAQQPRQ
jgi:alkyl sulfatase BDS1-like metallo-beta-lactamase superfamily hydrolase